MIVGAKAMSSFLRYFFNIITLNISAVLILSLIPVQCKELIKDFDFYTEEDLIN